ncbi:uncharacterized protein LOC143712661 [Siphateles boraxobius]|uniref:uncharacterized protein LOC143712661 n=1 Tax=Siphateles boraxobius TaxID=180520 RepID=UPI0040640221
MKVNGNKIYTELYITVGGGGEVNNQHEVKQIEATSWTPVTHETPIKCNDIFKASSGRAIRTVLTKGVAGIGKTVSVQKFILDWVEEKDNQDVHVIFPLPFRELNLINKKNTSLMELPQYFFMNTKELRATDFDDLKVLFIFDGLDECRLSLDFQNNDSLFDETESASVDVLLTNLIKDIETKSSITDLLKREVDKALQSENGHWDLYLLFLLGLSLESNQTLLRDILGTQTESRSDSKQEIVEYIKMKIKDNPSPEKSINLLCKCSIGEGCVALVSALRSNPSHLRELDLSWNKPRDSGGKLLSDLLKDPHCKLEKLLLCKCSIGEDVCTALASSLRSNPSNLRELNLSHNKPGHSAVELLSYLLNDPHCKLEKLQLSNCCIGEEGCAALATALRSNPSHLRELNLNYNKPGVSGLKLLAGLLKDPHCKLEKLQLCDCFITEECFKALVSGLRSNPSHLRELNLNGNEIGDTGAKLLSDLLQDNYCKLEKLQLKLCKFQEEGCAALASALRSNPSHLRELDLSNNKLDDSGMKLLSDLLKEWKCKLEKLQ